MSMTIQQLLQAVHTKGGSDLHLKVGRPPLIRIQGDITPIEGEPPLAIEDVLNHVYSVINTNQRENLERDRELDFSFYLRGVARFRGNSFFQKGAIGAVFRMIPAEIPTIEGLGLAPVLKEIVSRRQGFFLVTGPTGSGKTTTLAAILDFINATMPVHIITLEDPIEYVYEDKKSVINQREVGTDTHDFSQGLRRALRQDPDVILIGELRDAETMTTAINASETGHLVLGTLHTNDAKQTIDRIIDTYPPDQQTQIRMQLAKCLLGVSAQRLIRKADGMGRIAVQEILINSPTIQKLIEDNKIGAIGKAIEDSAEFYKMQSFNQALFKAIQKRTITMDEGMSFSPNPNDLKIKLQSEGLFNSMLEVPVDAPPSTYRAGPVKPR